jgi:hypothetical protein
MIHGPEATVQSVGVRDFDRDPALQETAKALGEKLRANVLSMRAS